MSRPSKKANKASDSAHATASACASTDALPSNTNRGVTVTLDYLRNTFHTNVGRVAEALLKHLYGHELDEGESWAEHFQMIDRGRYCYRTRYYHEEKAVFYAYPYDESRHCCLELSGEALKRIDLANLYSMIQELEAEGIPTKSTRIDVAFDHNIFKPITCFKAYEKGCYRTQAKRGKRLWIDGEEGNTFYMGSRQSSRFLRIYDMRGFTRTEMEFKEAYAEHLGEMLGDLDALFKDALGLLRSYIEFTKEPVEGKNSSRVEVVSWWAKLVDSSEKLRLQSKPKDDRFLEQRLRRQFDKLLPQLCVFFFGLGIDLNSEAEKYKDRLGLEHIKKLKLLTSKTKNQECL